MILFFKYLCLILIISILGVTVQPVLACVQGLEWGMDRQEIETHLGSPLISTNNESLNLDVFEISNLYISGLPINTLHLLINPNDGLQHLAYEINPENMTEVLAGLRHQFGTPVSTNLEMRGQSGEQQWIWHTGEDVITAVKSETKPFVLAYRPSLLDPSFL